MNKFFVGFEKRASSWDVADDFATDMRSKKSSVDKEYDAPLHYINHQPFKKKVRK